MKACNLICKFEGFRSTPYTCPGGCKTIGYGKKMSPGDTRKQITKEEAKQFVADRARSIFFALRKDLAEYEILPFGMSYIGNNQYAALISFIYNVGWENYRKSTLRQRIIGVAPNDMIQKQWMQWVYAKGKKLKGLENRRKAEYELFVNTRNNPYVNQ